MKKIFKNNKGFTLIELLAVIVVLAIIMVIATQQVNGTIKKARGESFYETVQSIRKNMQTVCATDNKIDATTLIAATSAEDVEFSLEKKEDANKPDLYGTLTVRATEGGKFTNTKFPKVNGEIYTPGSGMEAEKTVSVPEISFNTECPTISTDTKKVCPKDKPNCEDDEKIDELEFKKFK